MPRRRQNNDHSGGNNKNKNKAGRNNISNNENNNVDTPWWHDLGTEECPITLELLSTLSYPPFALTCGETTSYFDGLALASYIVSRGIFQNPLTRQDLTMDDCRRLDQYLEEYCYNQKEKNNSSSSLSQVGTRKISVSEAYALRALVHVDQRNGNQDRAQALRSTATAALAGLFVYGNDRRRYHSEQQESSSRQQQSRDDQVLLDWGFDLSRTVENTAVYDAGEGWTVIDDDEALVVASRREAYQAAQNAFPRLTENNPGNSMTAQGGGIDTHIVERVRALSLQEQQEEARKAWQRELQQQRLLQEALKRREARKLEREKIKTEGAAKWMALKKEEEEIGRARAEINAWREEQWEKLRLASEAHQEKVKQVENKVKTSLAPSSEARIEVPKDLPPQIPTPEDLAEKKKAKAALKRKKAKERKKEQKEEERAQLEEQKRKEEIAAKKAASALHCAACGQGILDCGFEKLGQKFCSPKCARTGTNKT